MKKTYNAVEFVGERIKRGFEPTRWSHKVIVHDKNGKKHEVGRMYLDYPIDKELRKILKNVLEV